MDNCIICHSWTDEPLKICRLCIRDNEPAKNLYYELLREKYMNSAKGLWSDHKPSITTSEAYNNMAKGKKVHPCPSCERLTQNDEGTLCKICGKNPNMVSFYWNEKYDKEPEMKIEGKVKMKLKIDPKPVSGDDWFNWLILGAGGTFLFFTISSLIYYNLPEGFIYPAIRNFQDYLAAPLIYRMILAAPLTFISVPLAKHLFYKFYTGGFFHPLIKLKHKLIANTLVLWEKIKKLLLAIQIQLNANWTRRKNKKIYQDEKYIKLKAVKLEVKERPEESYETIREFGREYREEPSWTADDSHS